MKRSIAIGERHSSIELLRLLCIFGIVLMHQFGPYLQDAAGFEILFGVVEMSLFNCAVSIFALISGYFGIRADKKKAIRFVLQVVLWSLLSCCITSAIRHELSLGDALRSILPITSRTYWYATDYFLLLMLSPWINRLVDRMTDAERIRILAALLVIAYVIPTVFQRNFDGQNGKSLLSIVTMYVAGRTLALNKVRFQKRKSLCVFSTTLLMTIALNYLGTELFNSAGSTGVHNPFAKDNSPFVFLMSVSIFMCFLTLRLHSSAINKAARSVFPIYLFSGAAGLLIETYCLTPASLRGSGGGVLSIINRAYPVNHACFLAG